MKKILYIGVLSALLLTACAEEDAKSKEETPAAEPTEVKKEPVITEPTQEELNAKLRSEAIELDTVAVDSNKIKVGTKVFVKGEVSTLHTDEIVEGDFLITTTEGEESGMYSIENYELAHPSEIAKLTVYGTYEGRNDMNIPTITATLVETLVE